MRPEKEYIIGIDTLDTLNIGKIPCLNDDVLHRKPNETYQFSDSISLKRNFKHKHPGYFYSFYIFIGDVLFGTIFYGNNGKYRYAYSDTCQISVENHSFYEKDWSVKLLMVTKALNLLFHKYHFMEIAVDGAGLIKRHDKLTMNKTLKRSRKLRINADLDVDTKENNGFLIGSKKSEKHIKMYNKTQEIDDSSRKDYIKEYWKINDLKDFDKVIDRCELRAKDSVLKNFSHDFSRLENPAYLASYFKLVAGRHLEFFDQVNPKKRYYVIDWKKLGKIEIDKVMKTQKAFNPKRYSGMLRSLFEEFIVTKEDHYLYTLANICARYGLVAWILSKVATWIKEFRLHGVWKIE